MSQNKYIKYLKSGEASAPRLINVAFPIKNAKIYRHVQITDLPHMKDLIELSEYVEELKATASD